MRIDGASLHVVVELAAEEEYARGLKPRWLVAGLKDGRTFLVDCEAGEGKHQWVADDTECEVVGWYEWHYIPPEKRRNQQAKEKPCEK